MTTAASLATLEPETAAFDVTVRVVRKLMEASAGGRRAAEVLVADDTASVIVQAVDDEIDRLSPGSWVALRNCSVQMSQRTMRVTLGRWSAIDPVATPATPLFKEDPCVSSREYTLPLVH